MSILGRGPSEGWLFVNSMDTELATGGTLEGKPALEVGASAREMDYLHVIDWKRAVEVAKDASKTKMINGIRVMSLPTAIAEKLIYFIPESKSPHGVDLVPGGEYIVVSGKLDPHTSVYAFDKIKKAIAAGNFEGKDPYGIPILKYDAVLEAHVQVGCIRCSTIKAMPIRLCSSTRQLPSGPWVLPTIRLRKRGSWSTRSPFITTSVTCRRPDRIHESRRASTWSRSTSGRSIAIRRWGRCTRRISS
jgi:hypothetical protein